jgi:NTP pyrophosphatase (non-canonical NTP hydrolase)
MDLRTFQANSIRTIKYLGHVNWDSCHMALGMGSELSELDEAIEKVDDVGVREELGDIMWYIANEATMRKMSIVAQTDVGYYTFRHLVKTVSEYQNLVKRDVVYNKVDNTAIQATLQKLTSICYNFSLDRGLSKIYLPKALDRNIAKLRERYPEKYTDDLAANRDLAAERRELEK